MSRYFLQHAMTSCTFVDSRPCLAMLCRLLSDTSLVKHCRIELLYKLKSVQQFNSTVYCTACSRSPHNVLQRSPLVLLLIHVVFYCSLRLTPRCLASTLVLVRLAIARMIFQPSLVQSVDTRICVLHQL